MAEKPVIGDHSNQFEPSLLDELLANIATLSSVYHKPPETFVTRVRTIQKAEEFPEAELPTVHVINGAVIDGVPSPTIIASPYAIEMQESPAPAPVPDLLDLGLDGDDDNAMVPVDRPATPTG